MISPNFYTVANLIKKYLQGKVAHYPIKEPIFSVTMYQYTMQKGDTLYSLADKIFGIDTNMWTVLAEINPPREVDGWLPGDVILLPKIVTQEQFTDYRAAPVYYQEPNRWNTRKKEFPFIPSPTCGVPGSVTATVIDEYKIHFSWNAVPLAAYYIYQLKKSTQDWADVPEIQILTTSFDFFPTPSTDYNFRVKTVCSFGGQSSYQTVDVSSIAPGTCAVPTLLTVSGVTQSTAILSWSGDSSSAYKVTVNDLTASTTSTVIVSGLSAQLNGLPATHNFSASVQKICSITSISGPSNVVTWTTSAVCGIATNLHITGYGENFITVDWDGGAGAISYEVIAIEQGTPLYPLEVANNCVSVLNFDVYYNNTKVADNVANAGNYTDVHSGGNVVVVFDTTMSGTISIMKDGIAQPTVTVTKALSKQILITAGHTYVISVVVVPDAVAAANITVVNSMLSNAGKEIISVDTVTARDEPQFVNIDPTESSPVYFGTAAPRYTFNQPSVGMLSIKKNGTLVATEGFNTLTTQYTQAYPMNGTDTWEVTVILQTQTFSITFENAAMFFNTETVDAFGAIPQFTLNNGEKVVYNNVLLLTYTINMHFNTDFSESHGLRVVEVSKNGAVVATIPLTLASGSASATYALSSPVANDQYYLKVKPV